MRAIDPVPEMALNLGSSREQLRHLNLLGVATATVTEPLVADHDDTRCISHSENQGPSLDGTMRKMYSSLAPPFYKHPL